MLSSDELANKIKTTNLAEAIALFKEKVLKGQLTHYDMEDYRKQIEDEYSRIDYTGAFYFFVEPDLGSGLGGVSDAIEEEQEKVALLLLLVEAYDRYVDVNAGIKDWSGYDCIFCDLLVSNTVAATLLTQKEYETIRDLIVMVVDRFVPSMTVMETDEYEIFKQSKNPNDTIIDNVQITLPLE